MEEKTPKGGLKARWLQAGWKGDYLVKVLSGWYAIALVRVKCSKRLAATNRDECHLYGVTMSSVQH